MTKYTEELDLLKNVLGHMRKVYKGKTEWSKKNFLEFTNSKKEVEGSVKLDNLTIEVSGKKVEDMYIKYKAEYGKLIKKALTSTELSKTPLKRLETNRSQYFDIDKRPVVAKKLISEFEKIGIKDIKIGGTVKQKDTIKDDLTLNISVYPDDCAKSLEDGYFGRLRTHLFDSGYTDVEIKDNISFPNTTNFMPLEKENVIDLKDNNVLIGNYYPERNMVTLYFNPFNLIKIGVFETELPEVWKTIFLVLKRNKVKTNDISKIQEKIFISEFLKNSRNKLSSTKEEQKNITSNITSHERNIRDLIDNYNENEAQIIFLETTIENSGKGLFEEVKKVKNLSFIEKVKIEGGQIDMKFKPTFIPIPDFSRSDHGKKFGKRFMWIGSIGFRVTADNFVVYGDTKLSGRCHPHSSSYPTGSPCFGSGDGRNKVYEMLSANKFVDLAKMLWFWIKTYRNSGAYAKMWNTYDSCLKQGYPMFDNKGKRIQINEPDRIKSGEQITLEKESNYESNLKKFAKIKLEA